MVDEWWSNAEVPRDGRGGGRGGRGEAAGGREEEAGLKEGTKTGTERGGG